MRVGNGSRKSWDILRAGWLPQCARKNGIVGKGYLAVPPRPHRPCRKPGCSRLTQDVSGYCDMHIAWGEELEQSRISKQRKKDSDRRGTSASRGYDSDWARVRGAFLKAHPLCNRCHRPSETAHHVITIENAPELRLNWSNLEALCRDCHEKHHGRKR